MKHANSYSSWTSLSNSTIDNPETFNNIVTDASNTNRAEPDKKISKFNQMDFTTQLSAKYLYDDFSEGQYNLNNNEVSPNGKWFHWYSGSHSKPGNQGVRPSTTTLGNVFFLESPGPIHEGETYSSLTLSTRSYKNFHMNLDVRTVSQTRENNPPNPWEVAWVFWHAIGNGTDEMDRTHFYYFLVKTNGLDIGKYDGGTNPDSQQIIAIKYYPLETSIYNKIGAWYNWDIIVLNDHITVKVNNATAFDIINSASFVSGRIGLYNEDSKTEFRNIYIKPIC